MSNNDPMNIDPVTDPAPQEPGAAPQQQEPHGDPAGDGAKDPQAIDWKAEARKWERRAKENNSKLKNSDDLEQRITALEERAQNAEREAADLKHKSDLLEVAAEFDVPKELIHGANAEEMRESAKALKEYIGNLPKHPVVEGSGKPAQPSAPVSIPKII